MYLRTKIINGCAWGAAFIMGIVFIIAAFSKIGDIAAYNHSLDYIAFLPQWGKALITLFLPGLELTLGMCLLWRINLREATLLTSALLLIFFIFAIYTNIVGHPSGCPCFKLTMPAWAKVAGWWLVARNFIFLALSLLCYWHSSRLHNRVSTPINA
jgi:methylamine utilization protein MauE